MGSASVTGGNTTRTLSTSESRQKLSWIGRKDKGCRWEGFRSGYSLESSPPPPCPVFLPHVAAGSQNPRPAFLGLIHIQFCIIQASSARLADASDGGM